MEFEWSEAKRLAVLSGRQLDFTDAQQFFDGRPVYTYPSPRGTEERWVSIAALAGAFVALVWTEREKAIRIITMRRARRAEERRYRALHG